ncbi:MAG: flagellar basal-body rod protein FlgF [Clostridiales bacterium]|nr:flagellar basal-body rod protein FlgF [Clostridiales bacterium]
MQQSLYTAAAGMASQQTRLDTIAQNIANTQSAGYKAARVDFKDALYQTMKSPVLADGAENNLLVGSGALVSSIATNFEQGSFIETGEMYDFAIAGEGFFAVRGRNGEVLYTRNGSFRAQPMDDGMYLVTQTGEFVLGADGDVIRLPEGGVRVAEDGTILSDGRQIGRIGLFTFTNPNGLSKEGETRYAETAASGPAQAATGAIVQGSLEQSNVSLADELTMLIRSQRAYALMSRALSTTDNMMGLANTMHG